MKNVVLGGYICAYWLVAELEDSTKAAPDRDGPLPTVNSSWDAPED